MPAATDTGPRWLPPLLVVLAVGMAYANALQASFQFDDWDVIVRDPRVQSFTAWWASMPGMRPILKLSYALNHASGLGTAGFHAVNVLIHAANGLLILYLIQHLEIHAGQRASRLALAAALIFVLHPVQTEAVTYASGRSTSLSTLFALASVTAWLVGRSSRQARGHIYVCGLAAAHAARHRDQGERRDGTGGAAAVCRCRSVPAIQLATGLAAIRTSLAVAAGGARSSPAASGLPALSGHQPGHALHAENLIAQVHGIGYLLGQLLNIERMNADPALPVHATLGLDGSLVLAGIVFAAGLALRNIRRFPLPAFAVLWFLLWMAPGNSLLARLDLVNDRQLYTALAGPALLLAAAIHRLGRQQRYLAVVALSAVLLLTGFATHLRNDVYRDEVGFWRNVIAQSPHNARAFNNLGVALAGECDLVRAEAAWRRALVADPGYVRAAVNLRLLEQGLLPEGVGPCRNL